jgi:PAB-dependent poly(A)-specific ribonuclease subunit 2
MTLTSGKLLNTAFASLPLIVTRFYNKTQYSGLEIHISNSYANSLLQVMHFTPIIRNMALQHAATGCINELCLLCEMGFLFDMLEKAEGSICQATNLLKTFSSHPQGKPL